MSMKIRKTHVYDSKHRKWCSILSMRGIFTRACDSTVDYDVDIPILMGNRKRHILEIWKYSYISIGISTDLDWDGGRENGLP